MTTELMSLVVRLNIVAAAAIVFVLVLRGMARQRLGADRAYGLWLAVPLAVAGAVFPPATAAGPAGALEADLGHGAAWLSDGRHGAALAAIWGLGVVWRIGLAAWRYASFLGRAKAGRAGPAVVGIFAPRLVTPLDFTRRFTPEERRLVRAHERAHMDRLDPRYNSVVLAIQCLNWFNPLVHAAARAITLDQELACDAAVMARFPAERRRYVQTLLRCQAAMIGSPLGCGWSCGGAHPLVARVAALTHRRAEDRPRNPGTIPLVAVWLAAFAVAWTTQPPSRPPQRPNVVLVDLTPSAIAGPQDQAALWDALSRTEGASHPVQTRSISPRRTAP